MTKIFVVFTSSLRELGSESANRKIRKKLVPQVKKESLKNHWSHFERANPSCDTRRVFFFSFKHSITSMGIR